jgi:thymidylate kinase
LIIEWIGCSGTGKSTLCEGVYKTLLASGIEARRPLEIFLGRSIAKSISSERIRNIALDFLILPWSICSAIKYRKFLTYCLGILNKDYSSYSLKLKLLRSILRKTGLHVFLSSCYNDRKLILFDEGTVHIAHLLFANGNKNSIAEKEIAKFCEQVPAPDLIVHIMAPEPEVIKRTLDRKDKPITNTSPDSIKRFIRLSQETFKILNALNPWEKKTITIFNPNNSIRNGQDIILNIMNQITTNLPSIKN